MTSTPDAESGWIKCAPQETRVLLEQGEVRFLTYTLSHAIAVLRLQSHGAEPQYLVCTCCQSLSLSDTQQAPVERLSCRLNDESAYLLFDESDNLRIHCSALRLFNRQSLKGWMDSYGFNPDEIQQSDAARLLNVLTLINDATL